MKLGVRGKLFVVSIVVVVCVGAATALYLEMGLKPWLDPQSLARLRVTIGVAGVVGLGIAIFMSALASHFMTRTLVDLVERTRIVAQGDSSRVSIASTDELGGLAGSINRLSHELSKTVSALRDERDRLQTILDSLSEGVVALDVDRKLALMNRASLELIGVSGDQTGRPFLEVIRVPALDELIIDARKQGRVSQEFDLYGSPARRVLAQAVVLPAGGTVVVMHDVTEMRRLEMFRRDLVANVSHELRTPVSVIRANAETLLDGGLDDKEMAVEFLKAIFRNADRLRSIVSDLLDLSRIEAGEYRLQLGNILLAPIVSQTIATLGIAAKAKQITLESSVPADLIVFGDETAIEQVLLNLLENAVKYTQAGGRVGVRALVDAAGVRVEVFDDGPGIDARHRERIFERFYRVDPGRSRELGGTGLGLSIVKHLVLSMNGQVGVLRNEPRGTIFWFTLEGRR